MFAIELNNRTILPSGVSVVDPTSPVFAELLKRDADKVRVSEMTKEVVEYNRYANHPLTLPTKSDLRPPPIHAAIPDRYKTIDVAMHIWAVLTDLYGKQIPQDRKNRAAEELQWFEQHNYTELLQTMIFVVDRLTEHNVPWGVGRGSAVCSYVLYLIGVHNIDPIKYNLDWRDFMRDEN
jgi:DNA polymerase III alpha subunit